MISAILLAAGESKRIPFENKLIKNFKNTVLNYKDHYLKDVFIFDFFENTKTDVIKIGFRLVFQATDRTLKDIDVDKIVSKILDLSYDIDGVDIPGMKK